MYNVNSPISNTTLLRQSPTSRVCDIESLCFASGYDELLIALIFLWPKHGCCCRCFCSRASHRCSNSNCTGHGSTECHAHATCSTTRCASRSRLDTEREEAGKLPRRRNFIVQPLVAGIQGFLRCQASIVDAVLNGRGHGRPSSISTGSSDNINQKCVGKCSTWCN